MALTMNGKVQKHRNQCVMDRCGGRDTVLYYRGRDIGRNPMHLCSACVHDIVERFIALEGREKAFAVLGDLIPAILPAAEENGDTEVTEVTEVSEVTVVTAESAEEFDADAIADKAFAEAKKRRKKGGTE